MDKITSDRAEHLPVAVYGTLRHGQGNYRHFLDGQTVAEQRGTVAGARMFDYGGFPFVRLTDNPDERVVVEVMSPDSDGYADTLARLDMLEGYRPGRDGNLYVRTEVMVSLAGGGEVMAWMYVAGDDGRAGLPRISSGDWVRHRESIMGMGSRR